MDEYRSWLAQLPGIGNRKKIKLLSILGSAKEIFYAEENMLEKLIEENRKLLTSKNIEVLLDKKKKANIEKEMSKLEEKKIKLITFDEERYPKRLKNIADPPYQLFYLGEIPIEKKPSLAIIGARECTAYGENMARRIGNALGKNKVEVISGMAKGIDGIAQLASIKAGGSSYAVLGSGVDVCYPCENHELYEILKIRGGILSEYIPGTKPKPYLFPPRNRIISALSDGVIVVEARKKSGTKITVNMALEQGKDVFVVPGRMTDGLSEGCNELIKEGAEVLVSVEEFIKEYFEGIQVVNVNKKEELSKFLDENEREVYRCIDYYPKSLNDIVEELNGIKDISEIMEALLFLEIKKYILRVATNSYILRDRM